jgi:regulator of protease activity HflC (stomatin/prohibitin superfamily)
VEDLGQFKTLLDPGFHCLLWPITTIVGRLSLRIQQLDVVCETKTKDNVFVQVRIAVQYRVLLESAYDAYYRLSDPRGQIQSYVFDVVRSTVPKMELDEAFASKQDIADATLLQLKDVMQNYVSIDKRGYCSECNERLFRTVFVCSPFTDSNV